MAAVSRPAWAWTPHVIPRLPDNDFFTEGDLLCRPHCKQMAVTILQQEDQQSADSHPGRQASFKCQAVDCRATFNSVCQYESHYNSQHRHPCTECRRSFPTPHLLDVHITEWHDPMFDLLCHSHNMYKCLVESCCETFKTYQQRKEHMMKNHHYPANFRFEKPPRDKKRANTSKHQTKTCNTKTCDTQNTDSMDTSDRHDESTTIRVPQISTAHSTSKVPMSLTSLAQGCIHKQTNSEKTKSGSKNTNVVSGNHSMSTDMDTDQCCSQGSGDVTMDITGQSGRRFVYKANVPRNICFGSGSQRGFHGRGRGKRGRHWHQTTDTQQQPVQDINMTELSEALDPT